MSVTKTETSKTVEKWFTVSQVMQLTGFKRTFIYSMIDAGKLRSVKVGAGRRIPESALIEFQQAFDGSGEIAS